MGIVGRLDQYASMLAGEFDDYSMSENLLLYSRFIFSSMNTHPIGWTGFNPGRIVRSIGQSPDGTDAAIVGKQFNNSGGFRPSTAITLLSSTTYTVSFYARKPTDSELTLFLSYFATNDATGQPYAKGVKIRYDDTDTSTGSTGSTSFTLTDSWQRFSYTFNSGSDTIIRPNFTSLTIADAYDPTGLFVIASIQIEQGSTATDYTPTTTTAISRVLPSTTNTNITGLGTYFSSGFSENVGAATTLVANVFPPYDLVYDDFGGTLFGAGQGRYMRQNTDKSVIVYNEIDEVSDFRDIVRTGLVLDLDAAQPLSYKGTGTTWNDLSGIGNNVSLIGSPTFNSSNGGSIVFNGSNYGSGTSGSSFQFTSDFSVDGWIYPTTISATHVVFDTRVGGAPTTGIAIYINSSSQLVLYNGTTLYITSSTTLPINNWYHFCISRIGSTTTMYVNSSSVGSTNTLPTSLTDGNCFIARTNEAAINYFIGRISSIRSYKNKGLTLTEVLQNYNALKHRFGL